MGGASDEGSVGAPLLPAYDAPLNATEPVEAQRQHISDLRDGLAAERARIGALERRLDEGHAERTRLFGLLTGERARVDQLLAAPAKRPRWWLWWRRG
jgi:hypothetical protein